MLDTALSNVQPDSLMILTVLTELRHRSGLKRALINREPSQLEPVFAWVVKFIGDLRYREMIIQIVGSLIELYGTELGSSEVSRRAVGKVLKLLDREIDRAQGAQQMVGQLEMLIAR